MTYLFHSYFDGQRLFFIQKPNFSVDAKITQRLSCVPSAELDV